MSIRHSTKNRKNQLQHSFPDSTSRQDVRAAAEACGDATVKGTTTYDAKQVFSVYDSIALFCGKSESYARTTWSRLISPKSTYKSEFEGLVHSATFCSSVQNNRYDTPAMTLRGLQRLLVILGGRVAADFRPPVHEAYRQALGQEPVTGTTNTKAYA